jgi:hypothetical protein
VRAAHGGNTACDNVTRLEGKPLRGRTGEVLSEGASRVCDIVTRRRVPLRGEINAAKLMRHRAGGPAWRVTCHTRQRFWPVDNRILLRSMRPRLEFVKGFFEVFLHPLSSLKDIAVQQCSVSA